MIFTLSKNTLYTKKILNNTTKKHYQNCSKKTTFFHQKWINYNYIFLWPIHGFPRWPVHFFSYPLPPLFCLLKRSGLKIKNWKSGEGCLALRLISIRVFLHDFAIFLWRIILVVFYQKSTCS